jgi:hypothetical protein
MEAAIAIGIHVAIKCSPIILLSLNNSQGIRKIAGNLEEVP